SICGQISNTKNREKIEVTNNMQGGRLNTLDADQSSDFLKDSDFESILDLGIYISRQPGCFIYFLNSGTPMILAARGINEDLYAELLHLCENKLDIHQICEVDNKDENQPYHSVSVTGFPLLDGQGLSL